MFARVYVVPTKLTVPPPESLTYLHAAVIAALSSLPHKAREYTLLDVFGSYAITPKINLTAGVYNVFNKEYYLWNRVRTAGAGTAGRAVRRRQGAGRVGDCRQPDQGELAAGDGAGPGR